ncbi:MAG: hypothetical protein DI598_17255 [Pseudopedobacter saltans]|uniref:Phage morphogenesis protein n=1 Tax=Pseudopedobacter saltans TaxID=151895 RepID=A0A2W5EHX2_9SPHI|nr:MAG: hypothetical protein DI598_17255 [Pseudopedobacter saltans]
MDNQNVSGADEMERQLRAMMDYIENDVTTVIGVESVNHFKDNFQNEGFDNQKWESRKTKRIGSTDGQKILSKSGDLAESIDYRVEGSTVVIYSDLPYAQIHNEGGKITVTPQMRKYFWANYYAAKDGGMLDIADQYKAMALAKEITIEQRQFMGDSPPLLDSISNKIVRDLTRIANS